MKFKFKVWKKTTGYNGRQYEVLANSFGTLKLARKYKVFANASSTKYDSYYIKDEYYNGSI